MPCDYSKYPKNWKSEIRPAILDRDFHRCKFCKVPNGEIICRGIYNDREVWQDDDGCIFDAKTGEYITDDYVGEVFTNEKQRVVKVVLTIMHLDHDVNNNNYDNLAAGCQKCHLNYDKEHHMKNSRATNEKKKGLQKLF